MAKATNKSSDKNAKKPAKKEAVDSPIKVEESKAKKLRGIASSRKKQTLREKTQSGDKQSKTRRIRSTAGKVATPINKARQTGRKEYHLPLPDNKVGGVLGKRVRLAPKFLRDSWKEIRQVTWPNMRLTFRLTMAVFIFSVVFAVIVGILDFGLDKLFREVIVR